MNSESRDTPVSPGLDWAAPDPATLLAPAGGAPPQPGPAEVSASDTPAASSSAADAWSTPPPLQERAENPSVEGDSETAPSSSPEELIPVGEVVEELPPAPVDTPAPTAPDASGAPETTPPTAGAAYGSWDALLVEEQVSDAPAAPAAEVLPLAHPAAGESTGPAASAALSTDLHRLLEQALGEEDELADLAATVRELHQQLAALPQLVESAAHRAVTQAQEEGAGERLSEQLETLHQVHTALRTLGTQNGELAHAVESLAATPQPDPIALEPLEVKLDLLTSQHTTVSEQQVVLAETLRDALPALADVIVERVSAEISPQVTRVQDQLAQLQSGLASQQEATERRLRQVTADVNAHVDQAILTLAQTLLRRRGRTE